MTNAWLASFLLLVAQADVPIPAGAGTVKLKLGDVALDAYTYRPADYKNGPLLVVFHGVKRNADEYRDHAKVMGDRFGALIVAPRFDAERFPSSKYQQGGLLKDGKAAPREEWTWSLVPKLVEEVRRLEKRPDLPYYLIGHSAGGQFLVRLAGFLETGAARIVAANPGTELFPTDELPYPFGFGKLPEELRDDKTLRRYLAQPLTLYLGTADTKQDANFDKSETANKQGESRYQRGLNAFRAAEKLAKAKGWTFNWRLVEAADVGHDAKAMFENPSCEAALFGKKREK